MAKIPSAGDSQSEIVYKATRMESVEEIRQAHQAKISAAAGVTEGPEVPAFHPAHRPPLVLLCILDDGKEEGEWIRIRTPRLVIGRTEGDVRIPFDEMMSSQHAELYMKEKEGKYRWFLHDLDSRNGTFVRGSTALLNPDQEFLIGRKRLRFCLPDASTVPPAQLEPRPVGTRGWQVLPAGTGLPMLQELTPQGEGERHLLSKPETWLGTDPRQCSIVLSDDPLISPRHARLFRDPQGRWQLENAKSRNGVWVRISKVAVGSSGQFQLGEQRFLVKVL